MELCWPSTISIEFVLSHPGIEIPQIPKNTILLPSFLTQILPNGISAFSSNLETTAESLDLGKMGLRATCYEGNLLITDGNKTTKKRYLENWKEMREGTLEDSGGDYLE